MTPTHITEKMYTEVIQNITKRTSTDYTHCRKKETGLDYEGNLSYSVSGARCLPWADFNITDFESNYCRNSYVEGMHLQRGPWCYTERDKNETCPVFICNVPDYINELYRASNFTSITKSSSDELADMVMLVFPPIILVLGTFLNSLSIALFSRRSLRDTTTAFLLTVLAFTDTFTLHMGVWVEWLSVIFRKLHIDNYVDSNSDWTCKSYWYLYDIAGTTTVWVLVMLTIERLTAITQPHSPGIFKAKKHVCLLFVPLVLLLSLIYIQIPLYFKAFRVVRFGEAIGDIDVYSRCGTERTDSTDTVYHEQRFGTEKRVLIIHWIDSFFRILLPFTIMLTSNVIILITLWKIQRRRLSRSSSTLSTGKHHHRQFLFLTVLLLTATYEYLLLTIPVIFWVVLFGYMDYGMKNGYKYTTWVTTIHCLAYVDQSLNFIFYCISGSKIRKEFIKMLKCQNYNTNNSSIPNSKELQERDQGRI